MEVKTSDLPRNGEKFSTFGNQSICETTIAVIRAGEEHNESTNTSCKDSRGGSSVNGSSEESIEERKRKVLEGDNNSCVIKIEGKLCEISENEVICRICHLNSDPSLNSPTKSFSNLVRLGCACKGELGDVHPYCLETWFKLKGNRQCEICGEIAKNVKGVGDLRIEEERNEIRYVGATNSSETATAYWRGQTFCNFLMACLVIAFVLPWFFRVKIF